MTADDRYDDWIVSILDDEREAREERCPNCGAETAVQHWGVGECSAGCETSQRYCIECDWRGEPQ